MSFDYSKEPLHKMIKSYVTSEGGTLEEINREYFTIKMSKTIAPLKFTYQPTVAKEQGIELIARGTSFFESLIKECLKKGAICHVNLRSIDSASAFINRYFKNQDYACENCEKIQVKKGDLNICTSNPPCVHRIHGSEIRSTKILTEQPFILLQFYFSVIFKNTIRKTEERIAILIDEKGNIHETDLPTQEDLQFNDSETPIPKQLFDELKTAVDEHLDNLLKEKQAIFDLTLNSQVARRLANLEKCLDEEKLEKTITSKEVLFKEKEWAQKKDQALRHEIESLQTSVSVKFTNLLIAESTKSDFEITLENNSKIKSSFILGLENSMQVRCPICGKTINEGYATEDSTYVCYDCINQSIETEKIYSKNYDLSLDRTLNEFMEKNSGFTCEVCNEPHSNLLSFKCSHSGQNICIDCCSQCVKCGQIFSPNNIFVSKTSGKVYCSEHIEKCTKCRSYIGIDERVISKTSKKIYCPEHTVKCTKCNFYIGIDEHFVSKISGKIYCSEHTVKCDKCGNYVGVDECIICTATGKRFCSCTKFEKCVMCEQSYSATSIVNEKCPACNSLETAKTGEEILVVLKYDPSRNKTSHWLIGKNALNSVIIAKGIFSDNLYIVIKDSVVHKKSIAFMQKLRGK